MKPSPDSTTVTVDSPSTCEPVSLELAKSHANIIVDDEDALVRRWIAAARKTVEDEAGLHLVTKTARHRLRCWPASSIVIPAWPLVSVESIKYFDGDGVEQTLGEAIYEVDTDRRPGVVWLAPEQSWPDLQPGRHNAITVNCTVGFDAVDNPPPEHAVEAMLLLIAHWARNREATVIGTISAELDIGYQRLIDLLSDTRYP